MRVRGDGVSAKKPLTGAADRAYALPSLEELRKMLAHL
jgi:hypothetical protein